MWPAAAAQQQINGAEFKHNTALKQLALSALQSKATARHMTEQLQTMKQSPENTVMKPDTAINVTSLPSTILN